jgi:hypothetical protein
MSLQPIPAIETVIVPAVPEKVYPNLIITRLNLIGSRLSVHFQQYNYETKEILSNSEISFTIKDIYARMEKKPESVIIVENLLTLLTELYQESLAESEIE